MVKMGPPPNDVDKHLVLQIKRSEKTMKYRFGVLVLLMCCGVSAEEGFKPLFNGEDLSGWTSMRKTEDGALDLFQVDPTEKAIHVYAGAKAGSKQPTDCLRTKKEYSNYVLKLEYKWLENRFAPRLEHDRDAGVLFHIYGDLNHVWPNSVEMQLGESNAKKLKERYVTGDLWVLGKGTQVMNERKGPFYTPGAPLVLVGKDLRFDKSFISRGNEKPHGEWNEITLTLRGGVEAIYELNGKEVNRIQAPTYLKDGKRVPLEKGYIGLQAEYAALMYRNIRIKELPQHAATQ
ncbi:DUF1080 domain-containing protein [Planctomycetota bacterium]